MSSKFFLSTKQWFNQHVRNEKHIRMLVNMSTYIDPGFTKDRQSGWPAARLKRVLRKEGWNAQHTFLWSTTSCKRKNTYKVNAFRDYYTHSNFITTSSYLTLADTFRTCTVRRCEADAIMWTTACDKLTVVEPKQWFNQHVRNEKHIRVLANMSTYIEMNGVLYKHGLETGN